MSTLALEIRPPVTISDYKEIYSAVNQALNDGRFGNSAARVTPLLDRIMQEPISDLYIFTRDGYSFTADQINLLVELTKETIVPTNLHLRYQK